MGDKHIDVETRTTADPATVHALLLNGESWPTWSPIGSFELEREGDEEREGIGAIRVFRTGRVASREQIVDLVPDRGFAYTLLSGLPLRDYRADVRLTPDGDGTVIHWHSSFHPGRPGTGWFYRWYLQRFIARVVRGLAAHAPHGVAASRPPAAED